MSIEAGEWYMYVNSLADGETSMIHERTRNLFAACLNSLFVALPSIVISKPSSDRLALRPSTWCLRGYLHVSHTVRSEALLVLLRMC